MSSKRPRFLPQHGPRGVSNRKRSSQRGRPGKPAKIPNQQGARQSNNIAAQLHAQWNSWPELNVILEGMPTWVTTSNLWDWFSHEGEIVYMDIYETPKSPGSYSGKIRFEPPPKRAFWEAGIYRVRHPDIERYPTDLKISVNLARYAPQGSLPSPVCPERWHPIKFVLHPLAIHFGSMIGKELMKVMKSLYGTVDERNLKFELSLKYKKLTAFFPMEIVTRGRRVIRQHKVAIEFSNMKEVYQTTTDNGCCALVVPLTKPPQYYWKVSDVRSTFSDEGKNWSVMESWNRATDIVEEAGLPMRYPVSLYTDFQDPGFIDIGRWTTLRFILDGRTDETRAINEQIVSALDDFNITTHVKNDFQITHGVQADMWKLLEHPILAEGDNALQMLQYSPDSVIHLPFEVRYQLEVCISKGRLNEHTISKEFLTTLATMSPTEAKFYLEFLADERDPIMDPMSVFQHPDADAFVPLTRIPQYCTLVRKATITPTTVRYSTPIIEVSNRVVRQYKHVQDRFLRIQFTEESERGRIAVNKDQNDEIYKRVLRTMYEGIRIGDRVYEFLAFGNSQLRVNGAFFFCPTQHTSCDDIRRWMGQFNHIKVVAKYAARLGQCFSTTREIRGISSPDTREIPDIERNDHCFTDGVGKISSFLARLINEDMALDVFAKPSAFQFRMGGCKGVLAIWPDDAKGMEVHIRESQKKFVSDSKGLEIIRCAALATATLNRQTITILECLGVPIKSFTDLLDKQLQSFELAMKDNDVAIDMLTKFVDDQQTTLCIADILRAGFKTENLQEPFVVNILNLWRSWSLKLLKEKARIQVERSAFVLGCVDETNTLRGHSFETEDSRVKDVSKLPQIFLQVSDSKQYNKTHVIQGVCIVGRNPSLHPGDIRVVEAVDCLTLHHLKDVVVFPATGDRPVPNMLSGGDLDGDDFFVIWEPSLMPQIWNYPPMNYSAPKPIELDRDVDVNDLRNFFVKYLKNDKLPLIATSHLALSDDFGPNSPKCLELAELHSKAVDYPKTGDPAILRRDQQPRIWPHFMEKKNCYHSKKALGKIYDKVVSSAVQFSPIWDSPFDQRIIKKFELRHDTLKAARQVKTQYDTSVRRLLSQHDLKTEFELWTSFAMSKPAVGSDYKIQEKLGCEFTELKKTFRKTCVEAAGGKQPDLIEPFIAAMYTITEEETKIALYEHHRGPTNHAGRILQPRKLEAKSMPLISFPWIFYQELCRIATNGSSNPQLIVTAGAHGKSTQHHAKSPEATPDQASVLQEENTTEESELSPEIHSHLPDGTVVHRGQPLSIFHPEDDVNSDDERSFSEKSLSELEEGESVHEELGVSEGDDIVKEDLDDTAQDTVGAQQVDEVAEDADGKGEDEDDAMDRLAKLVGGFDVD
ncbi:hypothetical protein NW762_006063 [Fusarium torreyae]|uniref:RNA-dependent RNA polymerase n=1 Tax=Fusarium torreyae TaxID=1237075 RepID=A0A9W8S265_9HYPO|nr:hypothetical protein NW762_006063 [Fusarium torreyae]